MSKLASRNFIVLASTFPRWSNDKVPSFVLDFARNIKPYIGSMTVIAPHFPNAKRREKLDTGIEVHRFRYAYPYKFENIAYGQFTKTKFYPVKVLLYTISEFWATLLTSLRTKPAVINAHWLIPQGFVAVLVAPVIRAQVVISIHGSDVFTLNGKVMRKVKRFILKRADAVVANSSATQAVCKELWPHKDYPIIPMGIDVSKFAERVARGGSKGYNILFVGRLARNKGVIYLCKAIKLLSAEHTDVHAYIIGDGSERGVIERYIEENRLHDVISLVGWVQPGNLPARYAEANVFVGPSIEDTNGAREALGLVFAEASAAGLPVIATDVGGIKDIVKDEITGIIIPQKNPQAICDALDYLYAHRKEGEELGECGRAYVRDNFSWESVTKRYLDLLDRA